MSDALFAVFGFHRAPLDVQIDYLHNQREGLVCSQRGCIRRASLVGIKSRRKWCHMHSRGECEAIPMCSAHQCVCRARVKNKRSKRLYCEGHAKGICEGLS